MTSLSRQGYSIRKKEFNEKIINEVKNELTVSVKILCLNICQIKNMFYIVKMKINYIYLNIMDYKNLVFLKGML